MSVSEADNKQLLPNRVRFFLLGTGAPAPSVGKLGRWPEMPDEADDLYERSPPHAMPARTRAVRSSLTSRETCGLAGHRVTSASGRSLRRMWSRWIRPGHVPSDRPIVTHAYALCRTL